MGHRINNVYMISLDDISSNDAQCLMTKEEESWLWHKRIAHIHMDHLNKLVTKELVISLPKIRFEKDRLCDACQKGKQAKISFQSKGCFNFKTFATFAHRLIWSLKDYEFWGKLLWTSNC